MRASLEARGLTKRYRSAPDGAAALADATFRYEGAGAVGFLGPNGAGKSTTLKLLVGLLSPTSGTALLNDVDVLEDRKRALWDVGAIIETPEPYPMQTIGEALRMVGRFRGLSEEGIRSNVAALSEELHLPDPHRRVSSLSKGQGQRVVLAAALLGDPCVILLDEPGSGLDPAERVVMRRLLVRLKRDHLILMSSHNMGEVTQICDDLIIIDRGRVLLRDRVDEVVARVRSRQIDVEFAHPLPPERLESLRPAVQEVAALSDRRFRLVFDGSDGTRAQIHDRCSELGQVVSFANTSLLLEEAYLQLVTPASSS